MNEELGELVKDGLLWDPDAAVGAPVALCASRCTACARIEFPAQSTCPSCQSDAVPVRLGPDATLAGFTAVLHAPPDAKVPVPYVIGVAAFDGDLSVMGLVTGGLPFEELVLGLPLTVRVIEPYAGARTYGFDPVG